MADDLEGLFSGDISGSGGGGSGGGGKGGGGGNTNESANTLRSDNRANLVELISEGPCLGLVNDGNSIYLDETPVVNANNSANFRGVQWDVRHGTPDQTAIPGNSQVETPFSVGVKVQNAIGPVIRTIVDENATAVRVVVSVTALALTADDGSIGPNTVQWQVQVRPYGGAWVTADEVDLINQKTTSPYQQASMVPLPPGGAPWDIQVIRLTADSTTVENQNDISWDSYTEIVAGSFTYPNSAIVFLSIDADLFDQTSIPTRAYDWYGLIIQIPSNYDPSARTYTGLWDGTFNTAWSNNPAWVFYDLITNDRYGLGQFVNADRIDKWSLYQIAQYCDQQVPDGYGGFEPRYTFNGCINNQDEAYRVLQSITAAWRGMAYWSLGQVFATIDAPADPVKLVSPANVVGGHFNYSGTALKARHTVALVSWCDPNDFYRPAVEVVINNDMLQQFGWRPTTISAAGATTRSLAHRYGKWVLDTEQYETETVEYQASWDHATVKPGDIIAIADPFKAGTRIGGRLISVAANGRSVVTDLAFVPETGSTYNIMIEGALGGIQNHQVEAFEPGNVVILATPLPHPLPAANAMWVIAGTDVNPRQYSVLSVKEDDRHLFTITALFHDPNKYARVEDGIFFNPIPYYRPKSTIEPPSNFKATQSLYQIDGHFASRILLSWTPGDDFQSSSYHIIGATPKGREDYGSVSTPSYDIENSAIGTYNFTLYANGIAGQVSAPVTCSIEVNGWLGVKGPYVSALEIQGQGSDTNFTGQNVTIDWCNNFPRSGLDIAQDKIMGAGTANPYYRDNVVTVQDSNGNTLRTDVITTDLYEYSYAMNAADNAAIAQDPQRQISFLVQVRNTVGQISAPDELTVDNPVPDMVVPNCVGGLDSVFVIYQPPSDADFVGALIWMSEDENFDPLSTAPVYDGPNTAVGLPAENLKTYYIRMACYDAFGKTGLNICPAIVVFTGNRLFDIDPPAVPTGLTLVAGTITMPTGEVVSELTASWDVSPSTNYAYFSVEIRSDGDLNWISANVDKPTYQWTNLIAGKAYDVQVRAYSIAGYPSNYEISTTFTMPAKTTPPGPPTNFTVLASLRSLFLNWTNPPDSDLADIEIWQAPANDFTQSVLVGSSQGQGYTLAGLTSAASLWFWIRAVNTSNLASAFVGPVEGTPALALTGDIGNYAITETLIAPDSISTPKLQANSVTANIIAAATIVGYNIAGGTITGDLIQAGTITGDLINVTAKLPPSITVGNTGITMGSMSAPAALINSQTTSIQPGKILIAGNTYLSDWRYGSDLTTINGGAIAANTITANKLTIGSRGITVSDLQFSYDKINSILYWTSGTIQWTNSSGSNASVTIPAGSFQWTGSGYQYPCAYVAWQEGASVLTATMDITHVTGATWIQLATYRGFNNLVATYGRTTIDGSNIVTGSITAAQLYVGELITNAVQIDAGVIQNVHLAGNITFDRMAGGTLYTTQTIFIGGQRFYLQAAQQNMVVKDEQGYNDGSGNPGRTRLIIGNLGGGGVNYGIEAFDPSGNLVFSSNGITANQIQGLGVLARQNTVDHSQTTGFGTLSNQNTVDVGQTTGFGAFATVNALYNGNIAGLVAAGAIAGTYISDLTAAKITSGTVVARMQAVTGSFDSFDGNGVLRARVGLQPGVDYGLFVWSANGTLIMNTSGVTGTFIRDLTVGTGKIVANGVSVSISAFNGAQGNSIAVGFYTDVTSNVLINFCCTSGSNGTDSTLNGTMYIDGAALYGCVLVSTGKFAIVLQGAMNYIVAVPPGYHTVSVGLSGSGGVQTPSGLSLTATVLKV